MGPTPDRLAPGAITASDLIGQHNFHSDLFCFALYSTQWGPDGIALIQTVALPTTVGPITLLSRERTHEL